MSTQLVKELRERTSAGIMDCKRALEEANGDIDRAIEILRQQGLARADKKSGRDARQGLIEAYIHTGGRIGSMIELNCETDFVARTDDFKALAHDLALQAAAMPSRFVTENEITPEQREAGISEFGDEKQFIQNTVFLAQPFIRQANQSIEDLVKATIGKLGENIIVRRVVRFEVGEQPISEEVPGA
jgi:elongation factor Ts